MRTIIADLGVRWKCDQAHVSSYLGVASALQQALRQRGNSANATSDWQRAVELGNLYARKFHLARIAEQQWVADIRVSSLSTAIQQLRAKGYKIDLPDEGGVDVPESEIQRIAKEIARLAASLGRALATTAANAMAFHHSAVTGRFNLGRGGQTVQLNARPQPPWAYLYQLGLRYFSLEPSAQNPQLSLDNLIDLVTLAIGVTDLNMDVMTLIFARPGDVVGILQKSVVYDSIFLVTQAKPTHARAYLEGMMSQTPLSTLEDSNGRTAEEVLSVALMLLRRCESGSVRDFSIVDPQHAAYASNLDREPAAELLRDIFTHLDGVNQELTFPPKDTHVDAAFRPLINVSASFWMQPPPMAARAIVNAALDWCRKTRGEKMGFDEKVLGPLFEQFVRAKLTEHGVLVLSGTYKEGPSEGECDAAIETRDAVIFLELKSKMLTRAGRSGDDILALVDLAQALVRPQAQAMERHAVLRDHGAMRIRGASPATIEHKGREVLKVSVTRGDLGSAHDRPFLQHFLRAGCISTFKTLDPERQKELNKLHSFFAKLDVGAKRANEDFRNDRFPFERSWSLSVFQLLLLLERTTDNESFSRELQRTRRMITPTRDFYAEYEFALVLDQHRSVAAGDA